MTPKTLDLFRTILGGDASVVAEVLAAGADVNASDEFGRNVLAYAALGPDIYFINATVQPRLSEDRLQVLNIICQHPELTLYSLNAPMAWAGGVTLLGLMSWLNMPSEIRCLFEFTEGLLDANAMDEQGATPLMYAARDGHLQVAQCLLAHGARPDLRDVSQHSAIYYALQSPQILWLFEKALCRVRKRPTVTPSPHMSLRRKVRPSTPFPPHPNNSLDLFFRPYDTFLTPPPDALFTTMAFRNAFNALLHAVRSDDVDTVRTVIATPTATSSNQTFVSPLVATRTFPEIPVLVNMRDQAGLTLAHHALARKQVPNAEILDLLYDAGADVGLHSALGFTPLHHLAQTARDDAAHIKLTTTPLYAMTVRLIRDLHAPLNATDCRGETPLHAAAEQGRSVAVLRAMLDCDEEFYGKGSAREARNDRGLRPIDVAKPQYLQLFGVQRPESQPRSPISVDTRASLPSSKLGEISAKYSPSFTNPSDATVDLLAKKLSNTGLSSVSSSSSSGSSGRSDIGHASPCRPPNRRLSRRAPTAASPPVGQETQPVIDVPACTSELLYSLSQCTIALNAYAQPYKDSRSPSLPDLLGLYDALQSSLGLATHVLSHWTARLETARGHFEGAAREYEKAARILERVDKDVGALSAPESESESASSSASLPVRPPTRRERHESVSETSRSSRLEAVAETDAQKHKLELSASHRSSSSSSRPTPHLHTLTRRKSSITFAEVDKRKESADSRTRSRSVSSISNDALLQSAPKISERGRRDLGQVNAILVSVETCWQHSQQSIIRARGLVESEIRVRERKLLTIMPMYGYKVSSHGLSSFEERSSKGDLASTSLSSPPFINTDDPKSPSDTLEELGRLLSRELQEPIEGMMDNLKKAQVWGRVIHDVLKGLHRRLLVP